MWDLKRNMVFGSFYQLRNLFLVVHKHIPPHSILHPPIHNLKKIISSPPLSPPHPTPYVIYIYNSQPSPSRKYLRDNNVLDGRIRYPYCHVHAVFSSRC